MLDHATSDDDESLISQTAIPVAAVLRAYLTKKVAFLREVVFVCMPSDYAATSCLVLGLSMIDWTFPASGLMERVRPPACSYESCKSDCRLRNLKFKARIHKSGDPELDSHPLQRR